MIPTLAVEKIRQRVAAEILAELGPDGWQESTHTYAQFGTGEGDNLLHKGFAVGCPRTVGVGGRQALTEGAYVETSLGVRWAYNLPAKDQVGGVDTATALERRLVAAIMRARGNGLQLIFTSADRPEDGGRVRGELAFRALHHFALV